MPVRARNEIKKKWVGKPRMKRRKTAKRIPEGKVKMPPPPITERRIPVPESVFENIQELVAKLKI